MREATEEALGSALRVTFVGSMSEVVSSRNGSRRSAPFSIRISQAVIIRAAFLFNLSVQGGKHTPPELGSDDLRVESTCLLTNIG
jgi:hypothetical protein